MKKKLIFIFLIATNSYFSQNKTAEERMNAQMDAYAGARQNTENGNEKVKAGNYMAAILDYNDAITYGTNDPIIYFKRGYAKYLLADYRGSIIDYNKAIKLNPNYDEAYSNRAASKINLRDYIGAKADATKAIFINPKLAAAYYNRGAAKINLGDKNGGCLDLSKGGELGDSMSYDAISKHCN